MPRAFCFYRKGEEHSKPVPFNTIDEEICAHLNVPCDPVKYYADWYDVVGIGLCTGVKLPEIYEKLKSPERKAVVQFLMDNFDASAWWSAR